MEFQKGHQSRGGGHQMSFVGLDLGVETRIFYVLGPPVSLGLNSS
jgi:hypothetical protein